MPPHPGSQAFRGSSGRTGALAEHVATCTSDVVEVHRCVGTPNVNTVTEVPSVTVRWDLNLGLGKPFTDQPLLEVQ